MVDSRLLSLICCPETRQSLHLAEPELLKVLQNQLQAGHLKNKAGQAPLYILSDALIREDQKIFYPVREGIPVLLIDEGIDLPEDLARMMANAVL